jgi:mannose-6-phosphate isomerase-like protein (cupin superfamily)
MTLVDSGKYNVAVALVRRPASAVVRGALTHAKVTEVYYILRGSGIQVTGGTLAAGKPNSGSSTIGPSVSGSEVQGGRSSRLGPGDLQIVPPDVPHGFTSIEPGGIDYLVMRIDPDHVLSMQP